VSGYDVISVLDHILHRLWGCRCREIWPNLKIDWMNKNYGQKW